MFVFSNIITLFNWTADFFWVCVKSIQTLSKQPALTLFLDAEKAFDRAEWSYLTQVLKKLNLGENCIWWISSWYRDPQALIPINDTFSDRNGLTRGCQQGCPLSPLLFNLAIELQRQLGAIKEISGIKFGNNKSRISLYTDDIVLYLSNLEKSIPET